jgi:hypothetical protein
MAACRSMIERKTPRLSRRRVKAEKKPPPPSHAHRPEIIAMKLDEATAKVTREIEAIERETSAPPAPHDAVGLTLESDLRRALLTMKPSEREKLIDNLDDRMAGAILRGHPATVAMTEAGQQLYRQRWRKARFPGETERLARLGTALARVEAGGKALVIFINEKANSETAKRAATGASRSSQALEAIT